MKYLALAALLALTTPAAAQDPDPIASYAALRHGICSNSGAWAVMVNDYPEIAGDMRGLCAADADAQAERIGEAEYENRCDPAYQRATDWEFFEDDQPNCPDLRRPGS